MMNTAMNPARALGLCVLLTLGCAQTQPNKESPMTKRASGTFDVKLIPMPPDAESGDAPFGRMLLDKKFHGGLQATSKGQMLATMGEVVPNSGAYVALERVTGTLQGHTGTFALQHSGTMNRGAQSLALTVVPDSGTGELTGLTGSMKIIIEGKQHSYEFDYVLP